MPHSMEILSTIRLLGETTNQRGDMFTRLAKDLFFSLGYDNLELDVPVSGRELDIQGVHRFEPRRVVAECKAHQDSMGGAELNKFLGVLTRERRKHSPVPISGYFVSLGGFTSTAIEQEKESGEEAIILFDSRKIIAELQKSRVVVPLAEAAARAGECVQASGLNGAQFDTAELLGTPHGYVWVIFFTRNKQQTHYALIHADGTPLGSAIAEELLRTYPTQLVSLQNLRYLPPSAPAPDIAAKRDESLAHYRRWLGEECGYIQLDGLPADNDLSATKLRLERLFTPLNVEYEIKSEKKEGGQVQDESESLGEEEPEDTPEGATSIVEPLGELLTKVSHIALLASPGGGKSTLLKRLATAYSFPERKAEIQDFLPDRDWLPLYLRCRDLRDRAHRPILELLHGICAFANMDEGQSACFRAAVSEALRSGRALLLVDGLDEISEEGARRAFAQNVRTFIGMFPQLALVVTSRIAGFRDVAGVIASTCLTATLAPLQAPDVERLCVSWHAEVIADTEKVRREAAALARNIWSNRHIRTLVENPLLLTTLLVVKRSNGEIPPTRAELYQEAVRVLVRTWNVEGYAPLNERETLARMMQRGIQVISYSALIEVLTAAADEMEAELQFAQASPDEFIERIEYRSSLLMQTGYQKIDDRLQRVFEFRHLTFQEYLAARGFVEEQYPGRNNDARLVDVLAPHFDDEGWQEVIPLAAVLAGRKADIIIQTLSNAALALHSAPTKASRALGRVKPLLLKCLNDEVTVTTTTLRSALTIVASDKGWNGPKHPDWLIPLTRGKFGNTLREIVERSYLDAGVDWSYYAAAFSQVSRLPMKEKLQELGQSNFVRQRVEMMGSEAREERIRAACSIMRLAFEIHRPDREARRVDFPYAEECRDRLSDMILSDDLPAVLMACWAMAWLGNIHPWKEPTSLDVLRAIFEHWRKNSATPEFANMAAWAIARQGLHRREEVPTDFWGDCDVWLLDQWQQRGGRHQISRRNAVLVISWYRRAPWGDEELAEKIASAFKQEQRGWRFRFMLEQLGPAGKKYLDSSDVVSGS